MKEYTVVTVVSAMQWKGTEACFQQVLDEELPIRILSKPDDNTLIFETDEDGYQQAFVGDWLAIHEGIVSVITARAFAKYYTEGNHME